MKLLFTCLLVCFIGSTYAQSDVNPPSVEIPNTFYGTVSAPFLKWNGIYPVSFSFKLYNRWGNLVFEETEDPAFVPGAFFKKHGIEEGVYFYVLEYLSSRSNKTTKLTGHVTYLEREPH
jgi:hypothetical protein